MFFHDSIEFSVESFSHRVRLFPLPDLVMFPRVLQPLHVFEPRYRELLADALEGDRLIAMALYRRADDAFREGKPPLFDTCCLGRIAHCEMLPDGRSNLMLAGLRRVRIVAELSTKRAYREAHVEVCNDVYPADGDADRAARHNRLLEIFLSRVIGESDERMLRDLSPERMLLGALTDVVAYTLALETHFKQQLLAELDVDRRASLLLQRLETPKQQPTERKFPPDFSLN